MVVALTAFAGAHAQTVVQVTPEIPEGNIVAASHAIGESFKVPNAVDRRLMSFGMYVDTWPVSVPVFGRLFEFDQNSRKVTNLLYTSTPQMSFVGTNFDAVFMEFVNIDVTLSTLATYAFVFSFADRSPATQFGSWFRRANPYVDGTPLIWGQSDQSYLESVAAFDIFFFERPNDFAFTATFVAATPEPDSFWLMGTGMGLLGSFAARKRIRVSFRTRYRQ